MKAFPACFWNVCVRIFNEGLQHAPFSPPLSLKVTGEPAQELGVQAGWVIFSVGGELAPQDTSQVTKLVMRMFKEKKDDIAGLVDFKFRVPIVDGFVHCIQVGDLPGGCSQAVLCVCCWLL